jgi:hypothetical protein
MILPTVVNSGKNRQEATQGGDSLGWVMAIFWNLEFWFQRPAHLSMPYALKVCGFIIYKYNVYAYGDFQDTNSFVHIYNISRDSHNTLGDN